MMPILNDTLERGAVRGAQQKGVREGEVDPVSATLSHSTARNTRL